MTAASKVRTDRLQLCLAYTDTVVSHVVKSANLSYDSKGAGSFKEHKMMLFYLLQGGFLPIHVFL